MHAEHEEYIFQCQSCGHTHRIKIKYNIDSDLYIRSYCPKCRGDTQHLWCGEDETEIYSYYNLNLDERYFIYNTK